MTHAYASFLDYTLLPSCLVSLQIYSQETLYTINMEARLPKEKRIRIRQLITSWLNSKKTTNYETLSVVGLLQDWLLWLYLHQPTAAKSNSLMII